MLDETLSRIEAAIKRVEKAGPKEKAELVALLGRLKEEVRTLHQTHSEQARSIASFADAAAHEATRRPQDEALRRHSQEGLGASVSEFEASHPRLVALVNELCTELSRLGI